MPINLSNYKICERSQTQYHILNLIAFIGNISRGQSRKTAHGLLLSASGLGKLEMTGSQAWGVLLFHCFSFGEVTSIFCNNIEVLCIRYHERTGVNIMGQQVKPPPVMPTPQVRPDCSSPDPASHQWPDTEDGPNAWAPTPMWETPKKLRVPGFFLDQYGQCRAH